MARELIYKDEAYSAVLHDNPRSAYCINRMKPVDAVEVVHGEWVQIGYDEYMDRVTCSHCKEYFNIMDNNVEAFNYCPNCGAKMDGGNEDGKAD